MKEHEEKEKCYQYVMNVSNTVNKDEFCIELYLYVDGKCKETPSKVIHNFDELIEFFENDMSHEI